MFFLQISNNEALKNNFYLMKNDLYKILFWFVGFNALTPSRTPHFGGRGRYTSFRQFVIGEVVVVSGKWKKAIKRSDERASSVESFFIIRKGFLCCVGNSKNSGLRSLIYLHKRAGQ